MEQPNQVLHSQWWRQSIRSREAKS